MRSTHSMRSTHFAQFTFCHTTFKCLFRQLNISYTLLTTDSFLYYLYFISIPHHILIYKSHYLYGFLIPFIDFLYFGSIFPL